MVPHLLSMLSVITQPGYACPGKGVGGHGDDACPGESVSVWTGRIGQPSRTRAGARKYPQSLCVMVDDADAPCDAPVPATCRQNAGRLLCTPTASCAPPDDAAAPRRSRRDAGRAGRGSPHGRVEPHPRDAPRATRAAPGPIARRRGGPRRARARGGCDRRRGLAPVASLLAACESTPPTPPADAAPDLTDVPVDLAPDASPDVSADVAPDVAKAERTAALSGAVPTVAAFGSAGVFLIAGEDPLPTLSAGLEATAPLFAGTTRLAAARRRRRRGCAPRGPRWAATGPGAGGSRSSRRGTGSPAPGRRR